MSLSQMSLFGADKHHAFDSVHTCNECTLNSVFQSGNVNNSAAIAGSNLEDDERKATQEMEEESNKLSEEILRTAKEESDLAGLAERFHSANAEGTTIHIVLKHTPLAPKLLPKCWRHLFIFVIIGRGT